jgi:hypothetical protein
MDLTGKHLLIAHRSPDVRARFAAALADARHTAVTAGTADDAERGMAGPPAIALAIVDAGMHTEGAAWIRRLRLQHPSMPMLIFAGTVRHTTDARVLVGAAVAGYINEHAATAQILPALAPHLFPANFDRRLSPRLAVSVPVSYQSGPVIAGAVSMNVSRGGMAIRTLSPLAAGAAVVVKFRLPASPDDIERSGHVVWADRRVGMGVQFDVELDERSLDIT